VHLEGTVPPVEQSHARKLAYCINDATLMFFIATVDNHTATKNRTTDIKSVEGTNVASNFSDCCAETLSSWQSSAMEKAAFGLVVTRVKR
jgi:hypothetical protein